MKRAGMIVGCLVATWLGCGNDVEYAETGAGGAGTTTTTSGTSSSTSSITTSTTTTSQGGAGGFLPGCSVETDVPSPYPVTFRLSSVDVEMFVRQTCGVELFVSSCADGYTEPLAIDPGCTEDCSIVGETCTECADCPVVALSVSNDQIVETSWSGYVYTFGVNALTCPCSDAHDAAPAHYRVSVPVYGTEQQALAGEPSWLAEADFTLPADGIVWVALSAI